MKKILIDTDPGADDALVPIVIDPAGKLWPRVPIGSTVDVRPAK